MNARIDVVDHFTHLVEQGKSESEAAAHTMMRYGIGLDELRDLLRERRADPEPIWMPVLFLLSLALSAALVIGLLYLLVVA